MSFHRNLIAALFLTLSTPAFAYTYDYKDCNGKTWQIDIPSGWYMVDKNNPEGLNEGIMFRISSNSAATWNNPMPPPGHAFIALQFFPLIDNKPTYHLIDNGYPNVQSVIDAIKSSLKEKSVTP